MRPQSLCLPRLVVVLGALSLAACSEDSAPDFPLGDLPDPAAFGALTGPGVPPEVTFESDELLSACSYLDGGPRDRDHHNTVQVVDGYLLMPWAHEGGVGGLSVFDMADPCAPVEVSVAVEEEMRETHASGLAVIDGRSYTTTASMVGIMFWDITDLENPEMIVDFPLPGVTYPDAYRRVVMSTFWQAPYVYVGSADNGVHVVDASDPANPEVVAQFVPEPAMRVGMVHAVGNFLVIASTEGSRTTLADISDPADPKPIPGGSYLIETEFPELFDGALPANAYFSHFNGGYVWYAQVAVGAGLIIYDVNDPSDPHQVGHWLAGADATGGYVFLKEDLAYVGFSNFGQVIDVSDVSDPQPVARIEMTGDLDTVTPLANVAVVSVDDRAVPDQATEIQPIFEEGDTRGPAVNFVSPADGSVDVALTSRVGVTFDEFVELGSLWEGSFMLREAGVPEPLPGTWSTQEGQANFWPAEPLKPNTRYELRIPAGGVTDYSGNAAAETFVATFTTER